VRGTPFFTPNKRDDSETFRYFPVNRGVALAETVQLQSQLPSLRILGSFESRETALQAGFVMPSSGIGSIHIPCVVPGSH
jgi:hypothetical protein